MKFHPSLTIIVPAYNEEKTLAAVISRVVPIAERYLSDYEIIIVDDASADRTGEIADQLARERAKIHSVHNPRNMNLGYNFRKGLSLARMEYVSPISADDDQASLDALIRETGAADFVLGYPINDEVRHPLRRAVSRAFVFLIRFLFRLPIRYYNGPAVFKTEILRTIRMTTFGFAYMAEIIITLTMRKYSYKQIPVTLKSDGKGVGWRVFRPRNVASVMKTLASLFWRAKILQKI